MKLFYCKHCKNLFAAIRHSGITPLCCGEEMELLKPQTNEAGSEKHLPQINCEGGSLIITVHHPMEKEHHIEWIAIETNRGFHVIYLQGKDAQACFALEGDEALIAAYAYCNLHGLWMTKDIE